jgi:hypothetical protein
LARSRLRGCCGKAGARGLRWTKEVYAEGAELDFEAVGGVKGREWRVFFWFFLDFFVVACVLRMNE